MNCLNQKKRNGGIGRGWFPGELSEDEIEYDNFVKKLLKNKLDEIWNIKRSMENENG